MLSLALTALGLCVGIPILALVLFSVFATFWMRTRGQELQFGLPYLKWLTLGEIVARGYSSIMVRLLVCALHEKKRLEARPLAGLSEDEEWRALHHGFYPTTVHLHEFRLIARPRRRYKLRERLRAALRPSWAPTQ